MSISQTKINTYFQIILIYIAPIALIYFNIIDIRYRMLILCFMCICIYGIMTHEKLTRQDIGLLANYKTYITPYCVATFAAALFVVFYAHLFNFSPLFRWWSYPHFWLIFIVISAFQEFAYRGFLMILLNRIVSNQYVVIFVNALLFTFLHVIFPNLGVALPLAFLGGLFFSVLYHRFPNLWLLSVSHAILNFLVVYYGFFFIKF